MKQAISIAMSSPNGTIDIAQAESV